MRRSSPRALSSPRARSRRRAKTSGEREGSWERPMRNAEFGMRNRCPTVQFRIPHSTFRIGCATATAPATVRKSRRCIVLAPPESAAYITRPPGRLEGGRSEEHTSELQSHSDLVCRLLLEKKKKRAVSSKY